MDKNQFAAFLACAVVPPIMQQIQQKENQNTLELIKDFYHSKVYALLENEESKLWHYSPLTLCNMYLSERKNGTIDFPEEAV